MLGNKVKMGLKTSKAQFYLKCTCPVHSISGIPKEGYGVSVTCQLCQRKGEKQEKK